jgi:hypothetical protein
MKTLDLDEALDEISVHPPGMWENNDGPKDWYAVSNSEGIIAYTHNESLACFLRLAIINGMLNPIVTTEES